jgi:hypothetical protein
MGMKTKPSALELHIEEVVLRGFSPDDRSEIADALESELARLLGRHGLPTKSLSADRLDGGRFQVAPGAKLRTVGGQVAKAVYHQLSPAGRRSGS